MKFSFSIYALFTLQSILVASQSRDDIYKLNLKNIFNTSVEYYLLPAETSARKLNYDKVKIFEAVEVTKTDQTPSNLPKPNLEVPIIQALGDINSKSNDVNKSPIVPLASQKCGIRNSMNLVSRITNGEDTELFEFPWVVSVGKHETDPNLPANTYKCGGSLIHPSVAITVAHCVKNNQPNQLMVRAGEYDFATKEEILTEYDRNVSKIIIHENYKKGTLVNDIAILILVEPFPNARNIQPICLPTFEMNFDRKNCTVSGWGKHKSGNDGLYQAILKKIEIPIVPHNQCQSWLRTPVGNPNFKLNPSFICAGGEAGKDACDGDGGSPLFCPIENSQDDQYYQVGMVSWGVECGLPVPGVYANIMNLRPWIDSKIRQEGLDISFYVYNPNG